MRDFSSQLGERLAAIAGEMAAAEPSVATRPAPVPAPAPAEPPVSRRRASRRRPALLGGAAAGLATIGGLVALAGPSAANLPIFDTPTTDAGAAVRAMPQIAGSGVDFRKAHPFRTATGTGYVLTTQAKRIVCIVIPDSTENGAACSTDVGGVEDEGFGAESTSDSASTFAFILPSGARDVRLESAGRTTAPAVSAGVVTGTIAAAATVTWTRDGEPGQTTFAGPFAENPTSVVHCPDGRAIEVTVPSATTPGHPATLDELERQHCR